MPDGSIPDPTQNPNEEKSYGFAYNYDDGHLYVYIKKDNNGNILHDSRYFTGGSQVELGDITQALLIVNKKGDINPNLADELDEFLDKDHEVVRTSWEDQANDPVIFELIDVIKMKKPDDPEYQKVIKACNAAAKAKLKE